MKKLFCMILALVLCLSLIACAGEAASETTVNAEPQATETTEPMVPETTEPEIVYPLSGPDHFDSVGWDYFTNSMSNRNNMHAYVTDGTWVYGPSRGYGNGVVAKVRMDFSEWTVIDDNTNRSLAPCLDVFDGYLYYLQFNANYNYDLIKVRTSGSDAQTILTDVSGAVQFLSDGILYTTAGVYDSEGISTPESYNLYFCDFDGQNQEKVMDNKVFYHTYINGKILYQCDNDAETLHIFDVETGEDVRLTDMPSYWPIFDGEYIYYTARENPDEWIHTLWRIRQDGTGNEKLDVSDSIMCLLMQDDWLYFVNLEDEYRIYRCRKDGSGLQQVTQDPYTRDIQLLGDNKLVYTQGANAIDHVYICDLDGANKFEFKN